MFPRNVLRDVRRYFRIPRPMVRKDSNEKSDVGIIVNKITEILL